MQVAIYYSPALFNENSEIFQVSGIKEESTESGTINTFITIEDTVTTLAELYSQKWRLIEAIQVNNLYEKQLFLEKN